MLTGGTPPVANGGKGGTVRTGGDQESCLGGRSPGWALTPALTAFRGLEGLRRW